jgi:mannosyltransferase OCH1-like enzyme
MKIPKIIHYVWVGPKEMGHLERKCIESWKNYFPDYDLILWNEDNIDFSNEYIQNAYKNCKWSNVSNYMRVFALKEYGGIYFDTDFEVIRKFDFLEELNCFIGFETDRDLVVNNAIMGATKSHHFINDCFDLITSDFDGLELSNLSGPVLATRVLESYGPLVKEMQVINDVHVFPRDYFSPYDYDKSFCFSDLTEHTYGIHHWQMSWVIQDIEAKNKNLQGFRDKFVLGKGSFLFLIKTFVKSMIIKIVKVL